PVWTFAKEICAQSEPGFTITSPFSGSDEEIQPSAAFSVIVCTPGAATSFITAFPSPSLVALRLGLPSRMNVNGGTVPIGAPPDVNACLVISMQPTDPG